MKTELLEIYQALKQQIAVVVATVINSQGSTPRTAGSKMIVYRNGEISGTIGGGAIEGDVIKNAIQQFDRKNGLIIAYDLRKDGRSSDLDLICGGHMEVMLEYIDPNRENELLYSSVRQKIERDEPFLWNAVVSEMADGIRVERSIEDIADGIEYKKAKVSLLRVSSDRMVFNEPVMPNQTVYIIGGGHVSKEIAQLTKQIGLKTLIFDDRKEFANNLRYPEVDGVHVCPEYSNIFKPFKINRNSYIIIITRGHSYDKAVLSQALATEAGYIGMMGSKKKRNTIYDRLITEGIDSETFSRVHCPIGLSINAETPAELAVSIVAELINYRACH